MKSSDVKRFGLILEIQAEIEAMKAANTYKMMQNEPLAYLEEAFWNKAEELSIIIHAHEDEL